MVQQRRRFIAGATCPECKAMDSIVLFFENEIEKLECIKCGYSKSQADEENETNLAIDASVIGVFKPE